MNEKPEGQQDRRDYANRYDEFARQTRDYGARIREDVERDIADRMKEHTEQVRDACCPATSRGGLVLGALIVLVGVAMLLDNFGIIEIRDYWRFWPVVFIAIGATKLLESQGRGGGLVAGLALVAVGTIWTLDNIGLIFFDPRLIWPLIVIGVGLFFLVRSLERRFVPGPVGRPTTAEGIPTNVSSSDSVQLWTVFGGGKRVIDSQNFRGGQLLAIFGGIELDLRSAMLPQTAVMDASAIFGGIEVRVPPAWTVEVRGSGVFGGYEDKTSHPRCERPGDAPRLIVTGAALFGGVSIKN